MKKSKKFLSVLCALCMVMAMSVPAFAASEPTAEDYAYMDIDNADNELRQQILIARRAIIYGENAGWTVNGAAYVCNADGTTVPLPEFSVVYPGWNLAEISATDPASTQTAWPSRRAANFSETVTLYAPSSTNAEPFYTFTGSGAKVEAKADTIPEPFTSVFSIGVRNPNKPQSPDVAYKSSMTIGQSLKFDTVSGESYSVRASCTIGGDCYMVVQDI